MNIERLRRPLTLVEIEDLKRTLTVARARTRSGSHSAYRYFELAIRIYRARRLRTESFGEAASLFQDPAWDMLLDIYAGAALGQRISITAALEASGVPATTALRQLRGMEQIGLVVREADPRDRRRSYVTLSDAAVTMMNDWFEKAPLRRFLT